MKKKSILFLLLVLISIQYSFSSNAVLVKVNSINNEARIEITYVKSMFKTNEVLKFTFPKTYFGMYENLKVPIVKEFQVLDEKGKQIDSKKSDNRLYEINSNKNIHKIRYTISDSWLSDNNENNNLSSDSYFSDSLQVYNFFNILGKLEGSGSSNYTIEINHNNLTILKSIESKIEKNENTISYSMNSYQDILDNPIVLVKKNKKFEKEINIDSTLFIINLVDVDNGKMKLSDDEIETLSSYLKECSRYLDYFEIKPKKYFYTIFVSNSVSFHSALEHNSNSIYHFRNSNKNNFVEQLIQFITHETLHLITPLKIRSNIINDLNILEPESSFHLWLYEGVTEYLSLKVIAKVKLKEEQDSTYLFREIFFKNHISKKTNNPYSIIKTSKNIYNKRYSEYYSDVYLRGATIAFLIDCKLSKNGSSLSELLSKIGANNNFNDDSLLNEIKIIDANLSEIIEEYLLSNNKIFLETNFIELGVRKFVKSITTKRKKLEIKSFRFRKDFLLINRSPINKKLGIRRIKILAVNGVKVEESLSWFYENLQNGKDKYILTIKCKKNKTRDVVVYPTVKEKKVSIDVFSVSKINLIQKEKYNKLFNDL